MDATYNDFLGETLAETYRTGKAKKANDKNRVTKQRYRLMDTVEQNAIDQTREVSDVALDTVIENSGLLQKYITTRGEVPYTNPAELATQAWLLRQQEINDYARALDIDPKEAEIFLDEAEEKAMSISSPESDSFIGGLFGAVSSVAGKALQVGAAKREAAGKKPGVVGFLSGMFAKDGEQAATATDKADIKTLAGNVIDNVKESEKKKEIRRMLPMIIGGVILLIIVVVLITRKASK
jgi:hypothetical protein